MAFPSRYEGFPNALGEGLAVGLPAVGFHGVSGVEDLIIHNQTGLIADGADAGRSLRHAMAELMGDSALRARLGDSARRHMARWDPQRVLSQWETLILNAARQAILSKTVDNVRTGRVV